MKSNKHQRPRPQAATPVVPDDSGVLTREELAKRLRVSTRTVSEWQQDRTVPYLKVGKVVLFYWPDVIAHLRENFRVCLRTATAPDATKESP